MGADDVGLQVSLCEDEELPSQRNLLNRRDRILQGLNLSVHMIEINTHTYIYRDMIIHYIYMCVCIHLLYCRKYVIIY